jgi:hypothetical protein
MRVVLAHVLFLGMFFLGGCIGIDYGVQPRTDHLAQLIPGQSRASDVLLALGEPRGKGAAHLSPDTPMRSVWYYEHMTEHHHKIANSMLIVFLQGETYDGYLWFSAAERLTKTGTKTQH